MKYTDYLGLNKPDGGDYVNIEDLNENADILDSALKQVNETEEALTQIATSANTKASNAVNKTNSQYTSNYLSAGTSSGYSSVVTLFEKIDDYDFINIEVQYYNNSIDSRLFTTERFLELFNQDNSCRFYHVQGTSGYIGLYVQSTDSTSPNVPKHIIVEKHENLPNPNIRIEITLFSRK